MHKKQILTLPMTHLIYIIMTIRCVASDAVASLHHGE